jgi:glucose/arabinose dehydrogenase
MRTPFTRRHATWILVALTVVVATAGGIARQTPPPAQPQAVAPAVGGPPFPSVQPLPFPDGSQTFDTLGPPIRVSPLAKGLVNPWSLTFLPDGNMLATETRAASARCATPSSRNRFPSAGVFAGGRGALMDVLLHPRFADNRLIYLIPLPKPRETGRRQRCARAGSMAPSCPASATSSSPTTGPWARSPVRIAFGRDGMRMTVGERTDPQARPGLEHPRRKGAAAERRRDRAAGQSGRGPSGIRPEIYSYGHRNLQGLAFHPTTGALWETEHGPQGGGELNLILPGKTTGGRSSHWAASTGEVISLQPRALARAIRSSR